MAQLLKPTAPVPGRISQILPSVKCSSCNQPVPIAELGDHVCQPVPPLPVLTGKPLMSPLSALELDPQKHQSHVAFPVSRTLQAQQPVSSHQVSAPDTRHSSVAGPSVQQTRDRAPSTASLFSARGREVRPEQGPSHSSREAVSDPSKAPFPSRPGPSEASRVRSPLASQDASEVPFPTASRSPTPGRAYLTSPDNAALRSRAASNASVRPAGVSPHAVRQPAQSSPGSPSPYASSSAFGANPPVGLSAPSVRPRAATNAGHRSPDNGGYELIYSTDNRTGPPTALLPSRTPPKVHHELPMSPMQPSRPRVPSTASLPPMQPLRVRAPSTASVGHYTQHSHAQPPPSAGRPPFERRPSNLGAGPSSTPPPQPVRSPILEIDTKIGGSAGMAGVGRRGFAAMAQAALFTTHLGHSVGPGGTVPPQSMVPGQGMDGRRPNAPKFLDIASATNYSSSVHTPPLSPANSGTSTLSPRSPFSQKSPVSAGIPSPLSQTHPATPTSSIPVVASSPISPVGPVLHRERLVSPAMDAPKAPLPPAPATPTTPSAASIRLPFFEKFKAKHPESDDNTPDPDAEADDEADLLKDPFPPSPSSDSESEYGGLAYARSNDGDDSDEDKPLATSVAPLSTSRSSTVKSAGGSDPAKDKVRFPSMASESQYSASSPLSPRAPVRSLSASTGTSRYSVRTVAKSTGALDRVMETLLEETATPSASAAGSPAPLTAPLLPDGQRDSRPPKLPMRSHTSPTLNTGRLEQTRAKKRVKERVCAKCEKTIDDGRWIQMDGGSVLCDRCWKNMYLPKCRRCNLTIEKQAVSSSDGQLKGKYHRECFNCNKCHKPFPDKSFYVLDGKPFCAYHYHEANDSLCADMTCGQPIEGPCAVSHAGHRYHPEHLLCEHPRCTERLVEYWEVDGRMLCERHAQKEMDDSEKDPDTLEDLVEETRDSVARAMKRVTRFIDLAGLGGIEQL